ncbi:hypothetical protein [Candidatus Bathycorpusculum sp.]|uniref:hypothetical protein n=1 Tax=Candidatus Bathycorpusculum sp. TaxID=2994959 RepID=UPI0028375117|nr:hypothetical protein [Candidatus Termitimicrobium sp.]MCL2684989.1 hypothetical protein [Candidatus Termitimicrobium sp.]
MAITTIVVLFLTWRSGFGDVNLIKDTDGISKIFATMTFPLSGVTIFVLGKAEKGYHEAIRYDIRAIKKGYAIIIGASILILAMSVISGLVSVYYIFTEITPWLTFALYLVPLVLALLLANVIILCIYRLTSRML